MPYNTRKSTSYKLPTYNSEHIAKVTCEIVFISSEASFAQRIRNIRFGSCVRRVDHGIPNRVKVNRIRPAILITTGIGRRSQKDRGELNTACRIVQQLGMDSSTTVNHDHL